MIDCAGVHAVKPSTSRIALRGCGGWVAGWVQGYVMAVIGQAKLVKFFDFHACPLLTKEKTARQGRCVAITTWTSSPTTTIGTIRHRLAGRRAHAPLRQRRDGQLLKEHRPWGTLVRAVLVMHRCRRRLLLLGGGGVLLLLRDDDGARLLLRLLAPLALLALALAPARAPAAGALALGAIRAAAAAASLLLEAWGGHRGHQGRGGGCFCCSGCCRALHVQA